MSDRQRAEHELMRILVGRHDLPVDSFRPSRRSLEDIYLELVTEAEIDDDTDDGAADEEVDHDG